jgi:DNA topoisomerase-1
VRNGRYGPYATDGEINASIPKKEDPGSVTLARVLELLEAKRNAPKRKGPPRRGRPRSAAGSA